MKINNAFVLREVYGTYLLVPVCSNQISNNIISLNQTGAYIVKSCVNFTNKADLLLHLEQVYNINASEEITAGLVGFLEQLMEMKIIVEG